jgi:hypothetical protein
MKKAMILNKKFVLILAILILGSVFLTGCGGEDELDLDSGIGITEPSGTAGEEEEEQEIDTDEKDINQNGESEEETIPNDESEDFDMFKGILKETDKTEGTVTIENEKDGELILEVNETSKIIEGESQITFDDLAENIGSEVIAEYDDLKQLITIICSSSKAFEKRLSGMMI